MSWSYSTARAEPGHVVVVTLCLAFLAAVVVCVLADDVPDVGTCLLVFGLVFAGVAISPPVWIVAFLLDRLVVKPLIERPRR